MKEIWKEVKGYEGYYAVSNLGNVKGLEREVKCGKKGKKIVEEKILQPRRNRKKYLTVELSKDGKGKIITIHRLVAIAFIPNPYNKEQVNHIDGNKDNNTVENLEWVTNEENLKHAWCNDLMHHEKTAMKLLKPVIAMDQYGNIVKEYESVNEASNDVKIWRSTISRGCRKAIIVGGFYWKYKDKNKNDKYKTEKLNSFMKNKYRRVIKQMDVNGNVIKFHPSIMSAKENTNILNIGRCLIGKVETAGGYKWAYATDEEKRDFYMKIVS